MLLLADITGYTAFLEAVAAAHPEMFRPGGEVPPAYPVMSSLLDVVLEQISPTFLLSEVEGDAVFAYALADRPVADAPTLLRIVGSTYRAFRERIDEAMVLQRHECQACITLPSLELKFVAHHGTLVVQPIAGRDRLLGPTVNVAHRLLKNSITERTGRRAYLFVTDEAADRLSLGPEAGVGHEEHYPDVGPVAGIVIGLGAEPRVEPIRETVTVRCAPDRAFELFTEHMGTWWPVESYSRKVSELEGEDVEVERLEFQARPGGSVLEHLSDGRILPWAQVIGWHPPDSLVMAWRPHASPQPPTEVEVTFRARDGGTLVDLGASGMGAAVRRLPREPV